MRVVFSPSVARDLGSAKEEFIRHFLGLRPNEDIDRGTLQAVEDRFHHLTAQEQIHQFAIPVWQIFQRFIPSDFNNPLKPLQKTKGPILAGVKEAPDLIYESDMGESGFAINALGYYKGGLASNTAHALRLLDTYAHFVPLLGDGPKADIHRAAIRASGIDITREVTSNGVDAYTHFCSLHGNGDSKQENWMAQYRIPFSKETIEAFTAAIEATLIENQGEVLVLSAIPPAGSPGDYFAELTELGKKYNSPTAFNSKQYDPMRTSVERLFDHGEIRIIKPNLVEFVEFLRYRGLLYEDSDTCESELYHRLKKQISNRQFHETFELARLLIENVNPEMVVFLSFSEYGAMVVNKNHAVVFGAPKIKLGCSSGAGDSGLANVIKTARDKDYNFWNMLKEDELADLLQGFIYAASATASLPGNNIAGKKEIEDLRSGWQLVQYKI
jgi:fructose-1-phosphate kinase PfkB-like protein